MAVPAFSIVEHFDVVEDIGARQFSSHHKAAGMASIVAFAIATCGSSLGELEVKVSNLWRGNDSQRIEFVRWIDREQSFAGLTQFQVRELLGTHTSVHDNQEYPYNGLDEKFTEELLTAKGDSVERPVMWIYQTLRKGSPESIEWGGEADIYWTSSFSSVRTD